MNDLMIVKFRMYHYKEFLKIFTNHFYSEDFSSTRSSVYCLLFLPTFMVAGFNFINPFSIFRRIAVGASFFGSAMAFYYNLKDELIDIAKNDAGPMGDVVRYRFQQLSTFDALVHSYREEAQKLKG